MDTFIMEKGNYFRLPPNSVQPHNDFQSVPVSQRARILVVEDDIHLMEGVREILELDGYEILTANSGVTGLKVLRQEATPPDLIVSDIMMPNMDGYQFFEAVRSEPAWVTIPFIFLTAKGEKSDIRLGKAMGADDYVTKPFGAEDLLIAVTAKLERNKQLQSVLSSRISEMKRGILTILNHEFRTPLTYVIAYADMLHRDASAMDIVEMAQFLKGVSSGADRLRRLVENFIYLVELETGELETAYSWRKRPLKDYNGLITEGLRHLYPNLQARHQVVEIRIQPDLPAITGDQEHLAAAISRLVDNASKFSNEGTTITIEVYAESSYKEGRNEIVLAVSDQGRGVPETELGRIFEAFYQIDRPKYEDQGAGSGLAIVRGIAGVHKAEISVYSVEGQGSTFRLHFQALTTPSAT